MAKEIKPSYSRRIFIRAKNKVCKIFTFNQRPDGSIYCFSPHFDNAKWLIIEITDEGPQVIHTESIGKEKVSFHASGMVAIRPNNDPNGRHRLIVNGSHLMDKGRGIIGVRHLFTVLMKEPRYEPETSPLSNRESDYCLKANEVLKPSVLMFFAVPQKGIRVNFKFNIPSDDLINVPNDLLGMHNFGLRYHDVFWFAYRTRHMEKWPQKSHVCYLDGFTFPILIGVAPGVFRIEYRLPHYSLDKNKLGIECFQAHQYVYPQPQIRYLCKGE